MYFETRLSKVIHFGTNQKCACHFLLVIVSNLGPILPHFRDIAMFLLIPHPTPPKFWSVLLALDCRCCGSEKQRPWANYLCNYFWSNPTYMTTNDQHHRQTDGQTTYDSNIALCTT